MPARIRVRMHGDELRVANTGSALTAAGVAALSSLRASAKRDTHDSVGHFGVGFTAVLSWSRAPRVVSTTGGIRFDEVATAAEIGSLAGAGAGPRGRRSERVRSRCCGCRGPPLPTRNPRPRASPPRSGCRLTTAARVEVARMLADDGTAEDLFWALTDLAEIDLPDRVVRCGIDQDGRTVIDDGRTTRRYRTADRSGEIPAGAARGPSDRGTLPRTLADHLGVAGGPGPDDRRAEPGADRRVPPDRAANHHRCADARPTSRSPCPPGWSGRSRSTTPGGGWPPARCATTCWSGPPTPTSI